MSPVTSILFLISAFSLLVVQTNEIWRRWGLYISTITLVVAFTFDLGYLYGTPLLYGGNIIPPAWNTSLAFTLLFFVIIVGFGQNELPVTLFKGDSVNARLLRGFLPVTLLMIILSGWIDSIFFRIFNNYVLVSALVTIFSALFLGFIILKISKKIGNDIDHIFDFKKEAEIALKESELHFRTLADSGQALIWTAGLDKKCNYFNKTWLDFTGRTLDQELGDGWAQGVHPDDLDYCVEIYVTAFDRREKFSMDYRLKHNDGSYRWIQDSGTPRYNLNNEFIGYIGHCLDITAQKEAMQAIKQSEERFRSTLDSMMEGAQIIGFDWKYIYLNNSAEQHNRRPKEELLGREVVDCWPGYEQTELYACEKKCMEDRVSIHREIEFAFWDGTNGWFDVSIQPVPEGIFVLTIDISERKNAEQLLKQSEEKYRLISSVSTDYTFSTTVLPDGSLIIDWVAGAFESISGYTLQKFKELGGWRATVHPDDFHIDDLDLARLRNNEDTQSQIRTINKNGEIVWVQVFAHPVWDDKKNCLQRIYGAVRDITHQKLAENQLKVSEEKYRSIFENSNVAIFLTSPSNGKVLSANQFACKLFGYTEAEICELGRAGLIDVNDSRIPVLIQERKEKGYAKGEISFIRKGGQKFECEISSVIFTDSEGEELTSMVVRDLTEQKLAESKIQKLNEELELKVKERTAELEQKNSDLVRMNKLFVGRELRMVELKQTLKEYEDRLNSTQ
ncbi:MAG: PAS domain S-box protein [Prolixibacteraceae bacterium]|nr:PAS domain S-box protein [Prolixibacteraceae bacterium]